MRVRCIAQRLRVTSFSCGARQFGTSLRTSAPLFAPALPSHRAVTPVRFAGEAAGAVGGDFKAARLIGKLDSIDGTIATCKPTSSKVTVGNNTVLEIDCGEAGVGHAVVFNLEKDGSVGIILLNNIPAIRTGLAVYGTEKLLEIPVGFHMLGNVITPLGDIIPSGEFQRSKRLFAKDDVEATTGLMETVSPNIIARQPVNYNLLTGFKVVDAMTPVGRGQRQLVLGDRQTGKTSLAVSTIVNQVQMNAETLSKNGVLSVYVSVGQRLSNVARIFQLLKKFGALHTSAIVAATAAMPAGQQFLAPYAGTTLGEHFRNNGRHVLAVYDDLSKQAVAYRQLSLLLRRPPGREAYPGDVFYLHSRLLERSAMMSPAKGAGSLTSLPIVETLSNDVTAYIVTNVISITDGQLYLDSKLFTGGQRPAVHIGLSVSRVGSSAQNKAMKQVADPLKKLMGEYRKMAGEQALGGGQAHPSLIRGARCLQLFNQRGPVYFIDGIVGMYSVLKGYMDEVKLQYSKFYEYLMVGKDLPSVYHQSGKLLFNMTDKRVNYLVRYWGLNSPIFKDEVAQYLEIHTSLFMTNFQARMQLLKNDDDLVRLKNMLYACKRAC